MKSICLSLCFVSAFLAIDPLGEKWRKRIDDADATFSNVVAKANNIRHSTVQKANNERLAIYRKTLTDATKSGDLDSAMVLKERLQVAESKSRPKPKGLIRFEGHDYALIEDTVTWHVAKRRCEEMGGHLATFESIEEQVFVYTAAKAGNKPVWIGVSNEEDLTEWTWITGAKATFDGSVLLNDTNREFFSSGLAYWPEDARWNDHNLGAHIGYVCEWE